MLQFSLKSTRMVQKSELIYDLSWFLFLMLYSWINTSRRCIFFCKMHVTFFNCIFACYIAQRILWHFVCHAEVCFVPVLRFRNACGIVCATARSSLLVRLAT